jgi:site-specific DNA recombinase
MSKETLLTPFKQEQLRAAIYVRVSTREQAERGYSIQEQINSCRKYCEEKGWNVVRIYVEKGISGKNLNRPKIQQLLYHAERQQFDVIVFWRLDRLTRSLQDACELVEVFAEMDIKISCVTESFDTTTANGRLMFQIKGALAEHERRLTIERSRIGIRARARDGKWKGGKTPFGYTYHEASEKLVINKKEAKIVRIIFHKYLELGSLNDVTRYLNTNGFKPRTAEQWSNSGVGNILSRKLYLGIYTCAGEKINIPELRIIEKEIFNETQKQRTKRKIYGPTALVKKRKRLDRLVDTFLSNSPTDSISPWEATI